METICYTLDRKLPVVAQAEVVVIGGGPGGLGAAVMAARYGADTLLIERYGQLGGMAASGEVTPFMWSHWHNEKEEKFVLDRPVYPEWIERMSHYLPADWQVEEKIDREVTTRFSHYISKDLAPLAAEDLCLEAGVKLLYHHNLIDTITEDGRIVAVVLASKSGLVAVRGKAFVDTTGDADLTVLAGGKTEYGNAEGHCQPMTLCFKLARIDWSRIPGNVDFNELYTQAQKAGKLSCPRENVLKFDHYESDVMHFNTTRVIHKSGVNGLELSEAEIEGRKQLRELFFWLRNEVPGFENAVIHSMASHIGVRETRRIVGINRITLEAFEKSSKYPDAVCRCNYQVDIHNPHGAGTKLLDVNPHFYYEIPYGCIVPVGLKNLTVGGRPISVDHELHSSSRVMPPACSLGQAAGVAAAMCAAGVGDCDQLDGTLVRAQLVKMGAFLQ